MLLLCATAKLQTTPGIYASVSRSPAVSICGAGFWFIVEHQIFLTDSTTTTLEIGFDRAVFYFVQNWTSIQVTSFFVVSHC